MRYSAELIEREINAVFSNKQAPATGDLANGTTPPQMTERRSKKRQSVHIRGVLYHGDRFQTTIIENLSSGGAGLNGAVGIAPGDEVTIRLLNGRQLSGEVIWWLAGHCGVGFYTELKTDDPLFQRNRSRFSQ